MRATLFLAVAASIGAAVGGCPSGAPAECSETQACPIGSVCQAGVCEAQYCATSSQCGIEQYCSEDRACTPGCQLDSDCKFGDYCDEGTQTCMASECTNSRLDCGYKEFCSPAGECYEAGGRYCQDCEDDADCGVGNYCLSGYCGVACEDDTDCPGGFDCYGITDSLTGNITGHACYTACWLFDG
jgi:hypothetical protein